ncbi:MAG TPA: Stp1/IreP family PP2C-type Ser/Thr phosphatase [Bryobacteraceae bacterium]|nr:Stp1/IreP family PP2C-type Ser/Thr phosphatase [Bryobacteraceae bacterium]
MKAAAATDRGRVRPANEDSVLADQQAGILIVADGMGGHAAGEVASDIAVRIIAGGLREALASGRAEEDVPGLLRRVIGQANLAIRERGDCDPSLRGMGTTLAMALVCQGRLWLAHVGDSRVYQLRDGRIRRLTEDHSLVCQMVRAGQITPEEARKHHLRNVITRSLGFEANALPEIQEAEWAPGDYLLLCSDGLTNLIDDSEIAVVVNGRGPDLTAACRELIALANERGGADNISAVVALNA